MNISKIKVIWKLLTGGVGSVVDYLLALLNAALAKIDPTKKAKIQAVLNLAKQVLSFLDLLQPLCPQKWQTAYTKTIEAVEDVIDALEDLNITPEELEKVAKAFEEAIKAWKGEDDETCVDCEVLDEDDCPDCKPKA